MKLHFKALLMVCFLALFMTSCDQNEAIDSPTQKEAVKKRLKTVAKLATKSSTDTPSTTDEDYDSECIGTFDCFDYVFPITLINGTEETVVNSETELSDYYNGLDENAEPNLKFPLTIKYNDDDIEKTIATEEELDSAYDSCFGTEEDVCFTINFPVTVMENGTTLDLNEKVVNSETELHAFIETLAEDSVLSFKYPISIKLADGSERTVESDEDFDAIYGECYGFDDYDDFENFDCFAIEFPIQAIGENGEEITFSAMEDLEEYLFNLPEDGTPNFVFPITITYQDNTKKALESLEELESAFDSCFNNNDEDYNICFDITYPINLIKNEEATSPITVNNDTEFDTFLEALTEEDYFDIGYPLTVLLADESKETINNDEEFIALVESCDTIDTSEGTEGTN